MRFLGLTYEFAGLLRGAVIVLVRVLVAKAGAEAKAMRGFFASLRMTSFLGDDKFFGVAGSEVSGGAEVGFVKRFDTLSPISA